MQHKFFKKRKRTVKILGIPILLFLLFFFTTARAQESINATGLDISGNGGSVSYSIGQVFFNVHSSTVVNSFEGVQLPYELSVVTSIDNTMGITLSVAAYPNPVIHKLTLSIKEYKGANLSYKLYSLSGKLIKSENITNSETSISMDTYVPATYLLRIISENQSVKTFKIIKR